MTTRYRVEYTLKTHRRDQLIEWIKGLLAVPFVLHSQPTAVYEGRSDLLAKMAWTAHRRYAEILRDVEELINDHSEYFGKRKAVIVLNRMQVEHQKQGTSERSKLKFLVPSVGIFFTPLLLEEAFIYQDARRKISPRRFVAPSFNDIRLLLNSAQVMSLIRNGPLQLVTFDGDVTLYDDGQSLSKENPVIPRIIDLLKRGIKVGIVTAAGYTDASKYYNRLQGLLEAVRHTVFDGKMSDPDLVVLGGESNYLFSFDISSEHLLKFIPREVWMLDEMKQWTENDITMLLDIADAALNDCVSSMALSADVLRKERAVGIIQKIGPGSRKFTREQLEETVLITQQTLETSAVGKRVPFCAFNGGNDVFVDIGDKSWGVLCCQRYFNGIKGSSTLHIGDQFLSAGANDFKARLACTTAWIANPAETVELLDEISFHDTHRSSR